MSGRLQLEPRHARPAVAVGLRDASPATTPRLPPLAARRPRAGFARPDLSRLAVVSSVLLLAIFVGSRLLGSYPWTAPIFDLHAYWLTRDGLDYASARPGETGAYLYSPAFAQVIAPLASLPWPIFAGVWTALAAAPILWLAGPWAVVLGLLPPVLLSIAQGQLDLAFALVAVVGFRWPAAWALPILTKVTPGVGLVWFLVRREWRPLAIALGSTAAVVAASAVLDPAAWGGWIEMLRRMEFPRLVGGLLFLPVDLWIRLVVVTLLVAWGARTDRRWTVPVGVCLALPEVWINAPTILVALLPLAAAGARTPAGRWLRTAEPRRARTREPGCPGARPTRAKGRPRP
jgi:hypothetical protein